MSQLFPTAEEQGMQSTLSDFLPVAKLFGLGALGVAGAKGVSKLGQKLDDTISKEANKPLFSPEEWDSIQSRLSAIGKEQGPTVIKKN